MNQQSFFIEDYEQKDQVDDRTEISQVLLYLEKEEAKEFKRLCKIGMQQLYPSSFKDSNVSDFLLQLLKNTYGK